MSTIVAISTAPTAGGIGIIRMSGEETFKIINKIFKPKKGNISEKGYQMQYGNIFSGKKNIDEVLVSFFIAPKSYTTEDMCEINSHGGIVVMREILELCLQNGAILAEPGEFTKRAFLNGRIDLSQAEAVADIINAKSTKEAEASINQLEGFLSKTIKEIKQQALDILVSIEASIDYPEYDIEEVTNSNAMEKIIQIETKLKDLINSFSKGKIIKDGIKTVILGRPNAGKSSLLNEIIQEDRAIVTEYEGTTRDSIEESIMIEGIPFRIIDTAGIRKAKDEVEKIGISKAKKLAENADLVIAIFDNSKELNENDIEILDIINNKKSLIILNKTDLKDAKIEERIREILPNKKIIKMSILKKTGIDELYKELSTMFNLEELTLENSNIITNIRHKYLIEEALEKTKKAKEALDTNMPIDIISIYIKDIMEKLGEITGENVSEEVIKGIFSKFCLGK